MALKWVPHFEPCKVSMVEAGMLRPTTTRRVAAHADMSLPLLIYQATTSSRRHSQRVTLCIRLRFIMGMVLIYIPVPQSSSRLIFWHTDREIESRHLGLRRAEVAEIPTSVLHSMSACVFAALTTEVRNPPYEPMKQKSWVSHRWGRRANVRSIEEIHGRSGVSELAGLEHGRRKWLRWDCDVREDEG